VLVSGLGGGLWASKGGGGDRKEVEGGGGDQRQPRKRALVLVSGLGSWWALKGGDGDQREAATPKTSTRCSFSRLTMVVVTTGRKVATPKTSACARFGVQRVVTAGGHRIELM
jgi:hypothetical protein